VHDQRTRRRRVFFGRVALGALVAAAVMAVPATANASSDVTVYSPSDYSTATLDAPIFFLWSPDNGQDFFRVVFSRTRSGGWQDSPYRTNETMLTSTSVSPRDVALTPGTWYWRICYGWNTDARHICYWDDDIRTLDVHAPAPTPVPRPSVVPQPPAPTPTQPAATRLTVREGASVVRYVLKQKFGPRFRGARHLRIRSTRMNATTIKYRVSWVNRGARYSGTVKLRKNAEDYTYWNTVRRR
jgi:hypothetical protein